MLPQAPPWRWSGSRLGLVLAVALPLALAGLILARLPSEVCWITDGGNKRIQVFDSEGAFKRQFANVGTPLAMCLTRGATQFLYVSHSGDPDGMEDAAIYKVRLDGTVVGKFGTAGKLPKEFGLANSLECRSENELLIGEMTNWRVQKVSLKK